MLLQWGIHGAFGQLSLTTAGSPVTIDFSTSISGVCSSDVASTSSSAMLNSTPAVGQLDADAWAFTTDGATSGAAATFPGSLTASFTTVTAAGSASTGWGMANISSDRELAIFPSGSAATPGSITLLITNNTGVTLNELSITYSIRAYNDQPRSNKVEFWHSPSNAASSYTENTAAEFVSTATSSSSFESVTRTVNLTSLSIANNSSYYVRWFFDDVSGSGSRDEFYLDDISIIGSVSSSPTVIVTGTLNPFVTTGISAASSEQTFTVSGTNLTNNIIVTPPTGYQVSTTSGTGFGSSVTLVQSSGTVSATTVYTRFNPTALADQTGGNITCASTGATTQNVVVSGEVTNLSAGSIAFIAFQGQTTDYFRIVALEDIPANTRIWFTDNEWDGSLGTPAFTSGEGNSVWTSPGSTLTKGTVVEFAVTAGTVTNGSGAFTSGLSSTQEQLFAYQGASSNPSFIAGYTTGATITSGSPTDVNTWIPSTLAAGTNFVSLNGTFGSSYLTASTLSLSLADLRSHLHNASNITTNASTTYSSWPTYTFNFLPDEPTTQPSFTAASGVGNDQMTLNFSGGNGSSYIVIMRQGSAVTATPADATNYSAVSGTVNFSTATELSAGQRIVYNGTTSGTSVTVTNLSPGTTYHYAIYAYNGSAALTNFYVTSPGTGNQATTGSANSNASDIIIHTSFTEPSNIAYHSNQENANLTDVNSIEVARFTLRDGGATTDADANNTTLNAITFTITNHAVLRRLALYNGTTELGEIAVSSGSASFTGLTLAAADNSSQDFSLRASFASTVTDNLQFSFAVSSATADAAGSTFAASDAGAAATSTTSDRNRIEVTATLLAFVQQPSNVSVNTAMSPSPTVTANDALGNRDLDYTTDMTATTTGTFGSGTNTVTPVSGLGTFSNLQFSSAATGRTIAVSSGSLTATGNSNTFDITSLIMPGDIAFLSYQTDNPDGFSIITFVDIPASQTFYFTENAWTTASGPLATNETTITWSTSASVIPAGTVINFSNTSGSTFTVTPSGNGSAAGSGTPGFSTSGEQILMFRGANSTTPSAFICGVSTTGWITTGTTTSNTSYLPSDLSLNTTGITFTSHTDNGYYNGPQSGSISTIKSLVNNGANWLRSGSIQTLPSWSFTLNATTTTLTANATVENLSLASGETFVLGANTLTINGTVSGSGTISGGSTSNLTIGGAAGTVSFTSGSRALNNLVIGTGSNASLTLGSSLDIAAGGTISFNATGTKSLTTTGQTLTLKANSTAIASIGNTNGATITGNITVEQYIPGGRRAFRLLSHPFSSAIKLNQLMDNIHITGATGATAGFDPTTSNNPSAFSFSEAGFNGTNNSGWTAFTNAGAGGNDINTNTPIRILYRGPRSQSNLLDGTNPTPLEGTIDWSGTVNQGTVNVAMGYTTASGANAGWNLLPNPYPSNYDLGNTASGDRNAIANFAVWLPTNGTRGGYASQSFGSTYIIQSGAAFFVQTGSATNFTFNESQKTTSAANAALLKKDPFKENALQLDVYSDSIYWDKLEIRNRDFGTSQLDQEDAPKMENPDVNVFTYTGTNQKLAIDNRLIQNGTLIPIGFNVSGDYHYTFKFSNLDLKGFDVQLIDKFLNKTVPVTLNSTYSFSTVADENSKGLNRFALIFNATTSVNEFGSTQFNLYPNPASNHITLSLNTANQDEYNYQIYNQLGEVVQHGNLDFNAAINQIITVESLSTGVYFIKVYNNQKAQTIKFIK